MSLRRREFFEEELSGILKIRVACVRQENTNKPAYSFNLQPTRQFLTRAALNAISQIRNYAVVRSRRKRERGGKKGRRVKRERKVGYKREQQNRLITFRRIVNSYDDKLLLIKAILACRYEKRHLESKMNAGGKKRTRTTPLQCPHRARSGACHRR